MLPFDNRVTLIFWAPLQRFSIRLAAQSQTFGGRLIRSLSTTSHFSQPTLHRISIAPGMICLCNRLFSIQKSAPVYHDLLMRTEVSILSQAVCLKARSYERVRCSYDLHKASKIRSSILSYIVRSFWQSPCRGCTSSI